VFECGREVLGLWGRNKGSLYKSRDSVECCSQDFFFENLTVWLMIMAKFFLKVPFAKFKLLRRR
jgi:hypothetical protein